LRFEPSHGKRLGSDPLCHYARWRVPRQRQTEIDNLRGDVKPSELSESQWRSLLEGLALAEYSLVLGAGASIGSKNGAGKPLLSGAALRDKLLERYEIPDGTKQGLRQIYDLANVVSRRTGTTAPRDLIAPWFSDCTVSDWYGDLVAVPWRVIWNLNIDDVLTNAYRRKFREKARQDLRVMSWRDKWMANRDPLDKVQAVHIHGDARNGDFVFGSLEYLAATAEGGAAHRIFSDEWAGGTPTIVVGASLDDELDLAAPLLGELEGSDRRPSVIVKPEFTEFDDFRLRQSGLIPIRLRADQFFEAVSEDWEDTLRAIAEDQIPGSLGVNPLALSFLRSFRKPSGTGDRWHDFYAGDEPEWSDIINGMDAPRTLVNRPDPADPMPTMGLRVYAFHGELSGTTTAEMKFLHDVTKSGREVLEYCGEGKFDPLAIHWMAKQGARQLLRVPGLEDFSDVAGQLKALCDTSGTPVVLVVGLRSSRLGPLKMQLGDALWPVKVSDRLPAPDINRLLEKLAQHNRLNVLLEMDREQQFRFIKETHNASLLDSVATITRGRTFAARYTEAYGEVKDPLGQRVLDLVLIASEARVELSLGLLARAANAPLSELRGLLEVAPLARLVRQSTTGVAARHWGLAARASAQVLTIDRRYAASLDLARALVPYIHPTTISMRTKEVILVSRLLDAQRVVSVFGRERASSLYDELEAEYAWNSRFWEQRALAELEAHSPRFERAEAWAREAVVRHEDGLSLNTLATVLLRRSVALAELEEEPFFEGLEIVDQARSRSAARTTEHPYVTAFSYLRRGRRLAVDDSARNRIDGIFNFWRMDVERSLAWGQPELRRDLETLISRYLRDIK
jgi:hypothetical protein